MTNIPQLDDLIPIIIRIVDAQLLPRFTHVSASTKTDGSVVTEADLVTQGALTTALEKAWPEIPLLGEEMTEEEQQQLLLNADYLWCLDPLDGTTNFAAGVPIFCTSLALLHKGRAILGIIYDPIKKECFAAESGNGASLNGEPLVLDSIGTELAESVAAVDLKRLDTGLASRVATEQPFRSQRNFGSGALDWAWLASGRVQLYLHGGQKLWDYMAGHLIFTEAGGYCSDLNGAAVPSQRLIARSVVAGTNKPLFEQWQAWIDDNK